MRELVAILIACALVRTLAHGAEVVGDTGQLLVPPPADALVHRQPGPDFEPTAAYRWLDVLLVAPGRDAERNSPRPTILSRTMAVVLTAMYDAWSAYDPIAVSTRTGGRLRRPRSERMPGNKDEGHRLRGLPDAPLRLPGGRRVDP
jgi:hypothetical protein